MKFLVVILLIGLALTVESARHGRKSRQVNEGDEDFWNNFQPTQRPNQRPSTTTTRRPAQQPGQPTARQQACINRCLSTNEYNPVCGSNGQQYQNIGKLNCARGCGIDVVVATRAACNPLT